MGKKKKKSKTPKEPQIAHRFARDLADLYAARLRAFRDFRPHPGNPLYYSALIVPEEPPYNDGAFRVQIAIPIEYPFRPPLISLKTKIYHPNIDEKGKLSLPLIDPDHWKPTTTLEQVIQALLALIQKPNLDNPIRIDVASEFRNYKDIFMNKAREFTKKYAENLE